VTYIEFGLTYVARLFDSMLVRDIRTVMISKLITRTYIMLNEIQSIITGSTTGKLPYRCFGRFSYCSLQAYPIYIYIFG